MREIKFRAWNGSSMEHSVMVGCGLSIFVNSEYGTVVDPDDSASITPCNTIYDDKTPVMQYTGLVDKNGVEIYEGDIVMWGHVDGFNEHTPRIAIVKLEPSLNFDTVNLGKYNHAFHYGNFAYARSIDKCMEVIGNIHQHPELLD